MVEGSIAYRIHDIKVAAGTRRDSAIELSSCARRASYRRALGFRNAQYDATVLYFVTTVRSSGTLPSGAPSVSGTPSPVPRKLRKSDRRHRQSRRCTSSVDAFPSFLYVWILGYLDIWMFNWKYEEWRATANLSPQHVGVNILQDTFSLD
jgi:hypothetical protein